MKALVFEAPERPVVANREPPEIGPEEVLIRSRAVGICHSDFELLDGKYIIPVSYPIVPGHEWSGEVAEVGRDVEGLQPGVYLFSDKDVGGMRIGIYSAGKGFSMLCYSLPLFESKFDHCLPLHLPESLSRRSDKLSSDLVQISRYATSLACCSGPARRATTACSTRSSP